MRLHYFKSLDGNFGDDLNAWIWPKLLGENFFDDDSSRILVGIGTLLNHRIPKAGRTIVFGSGYGYGKRPTIDETWDILCVRGPKTAETLNLPAELAITDPAILIHPYVQQHVQPITGRIGYIPHCDSAASGDWQHISTEAGLHYIDPRWSVDRVISEIGSCGHIVTEAMHGAIFADAMRVPWIPAVAYKHISAFKWQDWCSAMGMDYAPISLPTVWSGDAHLPSMERIKGVVKRTAQRVGVFKPHWTLPLPARSSQRTVQEAIHSMQLAATRTPQLSSNSVHSGKIEQLLERLDDLKRMRSGTC